MMLDTRTAALAKAGGELPTAKDYVQDGLITMWDSIEDVGRKMHDANASVDEEVGV